MGQRGPLCGSGGVGDGAGSVLGRSACWLPYLLIAAGLAFGLLTPPRLAGSPFFSAAPLVTAALYSTRATAVAGAASVLAMLGLSVQHGTLQYLQSVLDLLTVFTVAVLAILINRVVRRGDRELASARDIAEVAQRAVLPTPAGRVGGLRIAARYEAAQADAGIGGDLYAVQDTAYGVRLIVGDVRGKGLGAVEAVSIVIGAFREAAEQEPDLARLAARLEGALRREGGRREGLDQFEGFTTAVLAEIPDTPAGVLRLLNRGHPAPLLLLGDGSVRSAEPLLPALPLGMEELGVWQDRVDELPFPAGTTLLLFTDGVTEARDADGVYYDPEERLRGRRFPDPDRLLDALLRDIALHTGGGAADDMALLAIEARQSLSVRIRNHSA